MPYPTSFSACYIWTACLYTAEALIVEGSRAHDRLSLLGIANAAERKAADRLALPITVALPAIALPLKEFGARDMRIAGVSGNLHNSENH
eukprot:333706-Amphidinium_carterae.1